MLLPNESLDMLQHGSVGVWISHASLLHDRGHTPSRSILASPYQMAEAFPRQGRSKWANAFLAVSACSRTARSSSPSAWASMSNSIWVSLKLPLTFSRWTCTTVCLRRAVAPAFVRPPNLGHREAPPLCARAHLLSIRAGAGPEAGAHR